MSKPFKVKVRRSPPPESLDLIDTSDQVIHRAKQKPVVQHEEFETRFKPDPIVLKRKRSKTKFLLEQKIKAGDLANLIGGLPGPGEEFEIVGAGSFDAFHIIPAALRFSKIDTLYVATWSSNRKNLETLMRLLDSGKIKIFNLLISISFQNRYKLDSMWIKEEMKRREQRIVTCMNHAKVICFTGGDQYYRFLGSANFTGNPRTEAAILTNGKDVYDFNIGWMEKVLRSV